MADDAIARVRDEVALRIAEIRSSGRRMSPADLHARMTAIRELAVAHGLAALEGLADYGAHHALLPGFGQATRACLGQMADALTSTDPAHDRESILALLAVRLH